MIDYTLIGRAVEHYSKLNYEYIDVPWIISLDTLLITRPSGARPFSTFAGELVASGEQSFLEIKDTLKPGQYQCVTPCFRDEKKHDEYHLQYFIKNELIWIPKPSDRNLVEFVDLMIEDALAYFRRYGQNLSVIDVPLENAFTNKDIMMNGIEVGSYGLRLLANTGFVWVYGTGVAEPRLSQAIWAGEN
jgi:hypothetical protein